MSPTFFDRTLWTSRTDVVAHSFPFPLALTCARVRRTMERQQPVEAAWAVRDAWEVAIKFCACVAVADFLHADPPHADAGDLAVRLLDPRGLAIGSWKDALDLALRRPLKEWAKTNAPTARRLPALWHVFYKGPGANFSPRRNDVEAFTGWRNDVFGHGVFSHNLPWYAGEAVTWLGKLMPLYDALAQVFAGWRLVGRTADGQAVDWSGCDFDPKAERHRHDPLGHALPMSLTRGDADLDFGPLLSVQRCAGCDHPAAFFFDRQKKADETVLLEYVAGAKGKKKGWDQVGALTRWLPADFQPEFHWARRVYDAGELLEGVPIAFRDFDADYVRPAYLLDAVWDFIDARERGYILLDGPGGVGKSYLARGLAEKEGERTQTRPVLGYHVRPGTAADYQAFAMDLNRQVKEKLGRHTLDLQLRTKTAADLRAEFKDYLAAVLAGRNGLVLVVDALDEIPEAAADTPVITDLLPDPADLPDNCHVVLTSRPDMRPRARARWQALAGPDVTRLTLAPEAEGNLSLLRAYLGRHLPEAFRTPGAVAEVLRLSGGVFLYARHYAGALRQGVFPDTEALPPAKRFYLVFLGRLRDQVGAELYEAVYLRLLLLLVAAQVPVTREQLERWGLPADRLAAALAELRDFVRLIRHRSWHEGLGGDEPRYDVAHEAFVRYVEADPALSEKLRAAHRVIAEAALRHEAARWEDVDPADDGDLYNIRFVLRHADAAGLAEASERLRADDVLARAIWRCASGLSEQASHPLAVEVLGACEALYRTLVESRGRADLVNDLAGALVTKGTALRGLGRLADAVGCYDEAIAARRDLVLNRGRADLANDLAAALADKGSALESLGRQVEVVAGCDEAIAVLRDLVHNRGHADLTGALARAVLNKGVALDNLCQLAEAVGCYDEAITLLRDLVKDRGHSDLATDLARALLNKSNMLQNLDQRAEAVGCHDEAIALLRDLVLKRGRADLANDLTRAMMDKGILLKGLRRLADAVGCDDEAIAVLRHLVLSRGRTDLANDLAHTLMHKGMALRDLGQLAEAVGCWDERIAVHRDPVLHRVRPEWATDLARAFVDKGHALNGLGRLADAVGCYDEAVALLRDLVLNQGRTELAYDLYLALVTKGNALRGLGRLADAVGCYDEAVAVLRNLVKNQGRADLANALARALGHKGAALRDLGQPAEVLGCFDEAIALLRDLVLKWGRADLANALGRALGHKGPALRDLGQLAEAVGGCDEAIAILRDPVLHREYIELTTDLAHDLMNKGVALRDLGQMAEAVGCYDEAIALLRDLVLNWGRTDRADELAHALGHKGVALQGLGQLAEAVGCYDEAVALLRDLVLNQGRADLANHLAHALEHKGMALHYLGQRAEAIGCYDEVIAVLHDLVKNRGRADLANAMARALGNKGVALHDLGQLAEAVGCYNEATALLRDLVHNQGRAELANDLARVLGHTGVALEIAHRQPEAAAAYDESIAILEGMLASRQFQNLPGLLLAYRSRWNVAVAQADWPRAAELFLRGVRAYGSTQQATGITPPDEPQFAHLVARLRDLSLEERGFLLAAAGDDAHLIQDLLLAP